MKKALLVLLFLAAGCALLDQQPVVNLTGVDPTVRSLLHPNQRQAAFEEIVSWQKYHGEKEYEERVWGSVGHVVACPQPSSPPMFAIFSGPKGKTENGFSLVTAKGEFVNFFHAANSLHPPDACFDINGDGVVEIVTSWSCGGSSNQWSCELLAVIPVTPEQTPSLAVAYNRGGREGLWQWCLGHPTESGVRPIHLRKRINAGWETVASWTWSPRDAAYLGPTGRETNEFLALTRELEWSELKAFSENGIAEQSSAPYRSQPRDARLQTDGERVIFTKKSQLTF